MAHWGVPFGLSAASMLLEVVGEAGRAELRFDRGAIAAGEWWRLLSGHLVHLGISHMLLNVAALLLLWWLVGSGLTVTGWLAVIVASLACIDLGLWFLDSALSWYVGLSGLLHGLFAAGLVARLRRAPLESLVLGILLAAKLLFEQFAGPLPGSEASAGGAVVVNAHLYGAAGGIVAALAWRASVRASLPI
jgi:rhomboid family GlyGly-CTERM serine protease